jgi:hypothetical protein
MTDSSGTDLSFFVSSELQTARLAAWERRQHSPLPAQVRPLSFELAIRPLNGISSTPPPLAPVLRFALHHGSTTPFSFCLYTRPNDRNVLLAKRHRKINKDPNCNGLDLPQHDLPQNQDRVGKIIPRFSFFTLGLGRAA